MFLFMGSRKSESIGRKNRQILFFFYINKELTFYFSNKLGQKI